MDVEVASRDVDLDPADVSGVVDLTTEAYDIPPIPPPAPWSRSRVTPALIRWRLIGATHWKTAVDFRRDLLPLWLFPNVYSPETRQNRAGRPGRYVFYLLRGLDTHDLPNGYYRLEVQASDTRGNTATSVLPFRIDEHELDRHRARGADPLVAPAAARTPRRAARGADRGGARAAASSTSGSWTS